MPSRLCPALTLAKPRLGGVRTRPVTGAQKPEARVQALVASAFPMGKLGLRQSVRCFMSRVARQDALAPSWSVGVPPSVLRRLDEGAGTRMGGSMPYSTAAQMAQLSKEGRDGRDVKK